MRPFGGPDDARAHLAAADLARGRLTSGLTLPRGLHAALAGVVAVQIGTAAAGIAEQSAVGLGLLLAGLGVFLAVVTWLLVRFRQTNDHGRDAGEVHRGVWPCTSRSRPW